MGARKGRPENLKPARTKEEARERGRKGGIKSGEARKIKRDAMQTAKWLLDLSPEMPPGTEAMIRRLGVTEKNPDLRMIGMCAMFSKMLAGDQKALELALRLAGELPQDASITNVIEAETVVVKDVDMRKLLDSLTDEQLDLYEDLCAKFRPEEYNRGIEV